MVLSVPIQRSRNLPKMTKNKLKDKIHNYKKVIILVRTSNLYYIVANK